MAGWHMENVPAEVSCIICYTETARKVLEESTTPITGWHHCKTCTAMWCDSCMEQMYNRARDDGEVNFGCPQCRSSISEMQFESRLSRITERFGCSDEAALAVLGYENLFTEMVHLCECQPDGAPYYTVPLEAAARILSRDEILDVISVFQGDDAQARLRRMLRAADFSRAAALVLEGHARGLEKGLTTPEPLIDVLNQVATHVRRLGEEPTSESSAAAASTEGREQRAPQVDVSALHASVERLLASARAKQSLQQRPQQPHDRRQSAASISSGGGSTSREGQGQGEAGATSRGERRSGRGRRDSHASELDEREGVLESGARSQQDLGVGVGDAGARGRGKRRRRSDGSN
jgi:hypothetical protein